MQTNQTNHTEKHITAFLHHCYVYDYFKYISKSDTQDLRVSLVLGNFINENRDTLFSEYTGHKVGIGYYDGDPTVDVMLRGDQDRQNLHIEIQNGEVIVQFKVYGKTKLEVKSTYTFPLDIFIRILNNITKLTERNLSRYYTYINKVKIDTDNNITTNLLDKYIENKLKYARPRERILYRRRRYWRNYAK